MTYVLGIDLGTSGMKAVLFDRAGGRVSSATAEYPLLQPQNGWAEQDPERWWSAAVLTIGQVLTESGVAPGDIAAIGISGQMHGLTALDSEGRVLRPAILWCDQRTQAQCAEITERVGAERLIVITANPALTGFTASKILWTRAHEPEVYAKIRHILLPKDYLRYRLTGDFATEVSDASGMQLLDVGRRQWSLEVCAALEISPDLLPSVYESPEITGTVSTEAAALTGLRAGTPVVGGAGDNAAAAVGTGVVREGTSFTTIGTSGVVFAHTDKMKIDPLGRVHTFCCAVPGKWHVMGVTQAAGLSLQWFRNQFCAAESATAAALNCDVYKLLDDEAAQSPPGANRLFYLPYLMGERTPHLDPFCRGVFFGLSAIHTRRDLLRAVMEGVGYSLRDCVEILRGMGVCLSDTVACGGGGRSALWRQMISDICAMPVMTSQSSEGPALGAALLAAVGAGLYDSVEEACDATVLAGEAQSPRAAAQYEPLYRFYQSLYEPMKERFKALSGL